MDEVSSLLAADSVTSAYRAGLISTRTHNQLVGRGIRSFRQIQTMTDEQLLAIRQVGRGTVDEVRRFMTQHRLASDSEASTSSDSSESSNGSALEARLEPAQTEDPHPDGSRAPAEPQAAPRYLSDLLEIATTGQFPYGRGHITFPGLTERGLGVLITRQDGSTLDQVGEQLNLTRERVRQVEKTAVATCKWVLLTAPEISQRWQRMLSSPAVTEIELLAPLLGPDVDEKVQVTFGRVLLGLLGAEAPRTFTGGRLSGWWSDDPNRLRELIRQAALMVPSEDSDFRTLVESLGLGNDLPLDFLCAEKGSPIRFHQAIRAWVHRVGDDRDATWILLTRRRAPIMLKELSDLLGMRIAALTSSFARDERLRVVPRTSKVVLTEWGEGTEDEVKLGVTVYKSTLEAVFDILSTERSLTVRDLVVTVQQRYGVSQAAITNCFAHEAIGWWPDGSVGLIRHGASRPPEEEPPRPAEVSITQGGRYVAVALRVTDALLRGFSPAVSRYVTWKCGLHAAARERQFIIPGYGTLEVRRGVNGSHFSSLRRYAEMLGCGEACLLTVWMDITTDTAGIVLTCDDHGHTGQKLGDEPPVLELASHLLHNDPIRKRARALAAARGHRPGGFEVAGGAWIAHCKCGAEIVAEAGGVFSGTCLTEECSQAPRSYHQRRPLDSLGQSVVSPSEELPAAESAGDPEYTTRRELNQARHAQIVARGIQPGSVEYEREWVQWTEERRKLDANRRRATDTNR